MELTEYARQSYVNDLPEINDQALLWRKDYFEKVIKNANIDIEQAELILDEIGKESMARAAKNAVTKYQVNFRLYQYNSGAADNGYYKRSESFDTLEEAEAFRDKLQGWIESDKSTVEFAGKYIGYGYLECVDDITRITIIEEKLTRDKEVWEK